MTRAIEIAEGEELATAQPLELPDLNPRVFGLRWPRELLRKRITQRLRPRLEQAMFDEVADLYDAGVSRGTLALYGLEYRFVYHYIPAQPNCNDILHTLTSPLTHSTHPH